MSDKKVLTLRDFCLQNGYNEEPMFRKRQGGNGKKLCSCELNIPPELDCPFKAPAEIYDTSNYLCNYNNGSSKD